MSAPAQPFYADTGFAARPIYITDLDRCGPAAALSPEPDQGRWRMIPYEADGISGVMLLAAPETGAPEITYPLAVSGWHAVSVGAFDGYPVGSTVQVRLSGEKTFHRLTSVSPAWAQMDTPTPKHRPGEVLLKEVFWKVADLTGQDLVMRPVSHRVAPGDGPGTLQSSGPVPDIDARIAYIKLVPLSEGEVGSYRADIARTDTRRLFAHNDAHGIHYWYRPTTAEEIRRNIEPYRDTDFARIYWEAGGGDLAHYFSKIGTPPTYDHVKDFSRTGERLLAESWRSFRDQGVDPFQVAVDHAHEIGVEIHAGYRVAGFYSPPPLDRSDEDSFYKRHPELRGTGRNGVRTPRLAYTYPETRAFVVSLLSEMCSYQVDGVALLYNRRPPLVEYEPPVVEGFKAEHGEDPFELDEMEPRWLSYRARVLTQFMREVREAMDAASEEQGEGRRIEVSAIVLGTEEENLYRGMDLKAWVSEGLVDTLIPYTSAPKYNSSVESWSDERDLDFFIKLTKDTPCKLAPNLMPRQISAEDYMRRAARLYEAGIENFFFWDCSENRGDVQSWSALRRLGHREEVEARAKGDSLSLASPTMVVRKLGDWDMAYEMPG